MNLRYVFNQFSLLLLVLSGLLLLIGFGAWLNGDGGDGAEHAAMVALFASGIGGGLVGGGLWLGTRGGRSQIGRREALLLVAATWLLGAALAGLPFYLWAHATITPEPHPFDSAVNCYFEAVSGLTTTGATILTDIPTVPRSLLFWRSMTHWLGGLGIVVLFVAVLPSLGAGGKRLFRVEAPGPTPEGVSPHIRDTARILWMIYMGLTIAQTICLRLAGMSWYEAICHTFATLATGGFSTENASVGFYHSPAVDTIVIFFMLMAGVNFGLYYQVIRGNAKTVLRDRELRIYLIFIAVAATIVIASIWGHRIVATDGTELDGGAGAAIRHGLFQTVSIHTTTGFATADFNLWPFLAKAVLVAVMFVGGCAGSTGGGIKVIRVWIALKVIVAEIELAFRPNVVRPLKVGRAAVSPQLRLGIAGYVMGVFLIFILGALALRVLEADHVMPDGRTATFTTAATASVATLCNIGPGLELVGAAENYNWFSTPSKLLMALMMVIGRLEVFAIVVLFSPRFWRKQ